MTLRVGLRHVSQRRGIPSPVCQFRSGFETGDFAEWDWAEAEAAVQTWDKHHGTYSAIFGKLQPFDSYAYKTLAGVNPLYFCAQAIIYLISGAAYCAIAMLTLGRWTYEWCSIWAEYDPSTYGDTDLHLKATAWDWFGTAYPIDLGMVMDLEKWYLLQIGLYRDGSSGWLKAWVNRSFRGQVSGLNNPFTAYPDHCAGLMNYTSLAGDWNSVAIDCCCLAKDYIRIDPYE